MRNFSRACVLVSHLAAHVPFTYAPLTLHLACCVCTLHRMLVDNQLPKQRSGIPDTFYRHGSDALLNAAASNQETTRDGNYVNFPYTVQEVRWRREARQRFIVLRCSLHQTTVHLLTLLILLP